MAARRPSVCLFCQSRQLALSKRTAHSTKRRLTTISRRQLEAIALRPEDDGFLLSEKERAGEQSEDEEPLLSAVDARRQWKLYNPIDELREAALGFDALVKRRDLRLEVLRSLSNPWPQVPAGRQHTMNKPVLPEAKAAVIPHTTFRQRLRDALGPKPVRQVLRQQLLRCEYPKEILRVVAVAMQHRASAKHLAVLFEPLMRALYRCRQNVSDPEVLRCLNTIIMRFRYADLEVQPQLLYMALKFAARSRSLPAMKKFLAMIRGDGLKLSSNVFRSIIAKFSIGHRGLGEIRNGRWKRQDLMQVLTGFPDCADLPSDQHYHLGSFLFRDDWQYLHGWVAVLGRCRASELVWEEWELWKHTKASTKPRKLLIKEANAAAMTSKLRGDIWFVEQQTHSGDLKRAWQLLSETSIPFSSLKMRIKDKLLEEPEYCPPAAWTEDVRNEMVQKYDRELSRVEQALGVKWTPGAEDGSGDHTLTMDQEEALDKLGERRWRSDDAYGYPWETDPIVPENERGLHDAEEGSTA
ncbi:hypothetical protein CLAFUR4_06241 [Fulvia fulva]|nr:hypothetical protein CLAFUR4_06241 [Fulvia fulva]KAK4625350.1 hypothetical protein CLAFUR0_06245 [Fulvia fulva]WPV30129.1 hypothetical protein CLAFUW7_06234 [Fulvia fulva]